MSAITISRQMGSLGRKVAEAIAQEAGYHVVWREVINQAASRAKVPEVALATIDELDLLGLRPNPKDVRAYHEAVRELMQEYVSKGKIVIVGRAGQVILREAEDVLHVRIYAPFDLRVKRITQQQNISLEMARAQVETSDQSRARYLRRFYHVRWDDPELYDVMINTAHLLPEEAAVVVCEALKQKNHLTTLV